MLIKIKDGVPVNAPLDRFTHNGLAVHHASPNVRVMVLPDHYSINREINIPDAMIKSFLNIDVVVVDGTFEVKVHFGPVVYPIYPMSSFVSRFYANILGYQCPLHSVWDMSNLIEDTRGLMWSLDS